MAKKAAPEPAAHRGRNDIIGIVLMGCAVILLISLLSYDPHDSAQNKLPVNNPVHNLGGPIGSWMADQCIKTAGVSAYALPFILIFIGLGCFFETMAYLRRRWVWAVILFMCCVGLFGLYDAYVSSTHHSKSTFTGGFLGTILNQFIFHN